MFASLSEIIKYREAARLLTLRELQVRYSNSALGVVWSLFHPLVLTAFFTFAFTVLLRNDIPAYPVFFLAALLPWNFFSLSAVNATVSITGNSPLVNRVYFPREVLPLAAVSANAANFLIALLPLAGLMVILGVPFRAALAWFPVILSVHYVFTLGLGLVLAALNVYLRDVQQIVEALMLPLFFLTPVIYSLAGQGVSNDLQRLALIVNPMAGLVTLYRQIIYFGQNPDLSLLAVTALEALAALLIGLATFRRLSPHFVDEL